MNIIAYIEPRRTGKTTIAKYILNDGDRHTVMVSKFRSRYNVANYYSEESFKHILERRVSTREIRRVIIDDYFEMDIPKLYSSIHMIIPFIDEIILFGTVGDHYGKFNLKSFLLAIKIKNGSLSHTDPTIQDPIIRNLDSKYFTNFLTDRNVVIFDNGVPSRNIDVKVDQVSLFPNKNEWLL